MSTSSPRVFLGRESEVTRLRAMLRDVAAGQGEVALVEGEAGIGKSALLGVALADAGALGVRTLWGTAEELGVRFPLSAVADCLPVAERTEILGALRRSEPALVGAGDPVLAATERLVTHLERGCAESPLLVVLDDLHWADEPSLLVWNRLARLAGQMPLLLVAAMRPVPVRPEITSLKRVLAGRGAVLLPLGPLQPNQVSELVAALTGGEDDGQMRQVAVRAGGNPLYVEEIMHSARRTGTPGVPASLTAVIGDRLGFLSPATAQTLRAAALLGTEFMVTDLATVTGRGVTDLIADIEEACAAGVLVDSTTGLKFRHELIRQSLHDGIPAGLRTALHRQAAQALDAAGVSVLRVAEHLVAAPELTDSWVLDWTVRAAAALSPAAPDVAAELLVRALGELGDDDCRRGTVESQLATVLRLRGRLEDLERLARTAAARSVDPAHTARMSWIFAHARLRAGRAADCMDITVTALASAGSAPAPGIWTARLRALHATALANLGRNSEAKRVGDQALAEAEAAGDAFAVMFALHALSLQVAFDDCGAALALIDRALSGSAGGSETADIRLVLVTNRIYALILLDRMTEADVAIGQSVIEAERLGAPRLASLRAIYAVHRFFTGQWDDALAEAESVLVDLEEPVRASTVSGLVAVIAGHRDERAVVARVLAETAGLTIDDGITQDNAIYLLMARTLAAERVGRVGDALAQLAPVLDPGFARYLSLRHVLMPWLVRLALAAGDRDTAITATSACVADAARERLRCREVAALRCRGLMEGDAALMDEAVRHYAAVGRQLERAETVEDQAVLLAGRGDQAGARRAFADALEGYQALGAEWDIMRIEARLRPLGIRRGRVGGHGRPRTGWQALTPTELKVAKLVALGGSNPDIAGELFLSSRTVQAHVSHILAKLGARSRSEIARQAAQHSA